MNFGKESGEMLGSLGAIGICETAPAGKEEWAGISTLFYPVHILISLKLSKNIIKRS